MRHLDGGVLHAKASGRASRAYNRRPAPPHAHKLGGRPAHRQCRADCRARGFFHWYIEFPEVFDNGGFDVVLGNPPWERIKLQQKEFFATRDRAIANAPNKAARDRLISEMRRSNPTLANEFDDKLSTTLRLPVTSHTTRRASHLLVRAMSTPTRFSRRLRESYLRPMAGWA